MAKSIQELRRERGFRSSREFAEALGVSPSSMSRYDKDPTLIPVKVMWAMADLLGCSMDEVAGREPVTSGRSEVQEAYDGLSPESRALADEFLEFCRARDERAARRRAEEAERRYEQQARFYERMMYQALEDGSGFGEAPDLGTPEQEREAFRSFVASKAAEKRDAAVAEHLAGLEEELREGYLDAEGNARSYTEDEVAQILRGERDQMAFDQANRDEEVIARIMGAYDRLHGTMGLTGQMLEAAFGRCQRLGVEYLGDRRR